MDKGSANAAVLACFVCALTQHPVPPGLVPAVKVVTALLPLTGNSKRRNYIDRQESHEALDSQIRLDSWTAPMGSATQKAKSRNGKRQVSRESSEFQIHVSILNNLL